MRLLSYAVATSSADSSMNTRPPEFANPTGSPAPSSAPICTAARPAEPDDKAPDRRTSRPRQPPESENAQAIDVRPDAAPRPRTGFLNPTRLTAIIRYVIVSSSDRGALDL